ncbi:Fur family transcriptional regulator [Teredinibacter turnerae]|uniref:Fur family transcriptional regulator n=1 Tax=Teredinibacter turnerae TaxID=2426 RepID=UPI00036E3E2E|nr:transcriptional repressor [Teredinibacter turnerae]
MNEQRLNEILRSAQNRCAHSGAKLTAKRRRILEILLSKKTPQSAYEVAGLYNKNSDTRMPPMSVYRILEFLESEHLVHKLSSTNKYIACSHITCDHKHEVPQFLICESCNSVKEVLISRSTLEDIGQQVLASGYKLVNDHLELRCLCASCVQKND